MIKAMNMATTAVIEPTIPNIIFLRAFLASNLDSMLSS